MDDAMEQHEHAEHAAQEGNKRAALLVSVLAATLAICEQGAKHAEIRLETSSIAAADAWAEYQAKSIRSTIARDLGDVVATLQAPAVASASLQRTDVIKRLKDDQNRYDHGADGKDEIAGRAKALEKKRDLAMEQSHSFDNAAASLQLGIVLATASVITASTPLLFASAGLGILGLIFGILGLVAPSIGAF